MSNKSFFCRRNKWLMSILLCLIVILIIIFAGFYGFFSDPRFNNTPEIITVVVLIFGLVIAALEYLAKEKKAEIDRKLKLDEAMRIKAEEFISRWNSPDFNEQKSLAAFGYNKYLKKYMRIIDAWVVNSSKKRLADMVTRGYCPSDVKEAINAIEEFNNLHRSEDESDEQYKEKARCLLSVFGILNFFEELGHAYIQDFVSTKRIQEYFDSIVLDMFLTYGTYSGAVWNYENSYPYFNKLYEIMGNIKDEDLKIMLRRKWEKESD